MNIHYRKLQPADSKLYREVRLESLQKFPGSFGSSYEAEIAKPKLSFELNIEQQSSDKFIIGAFDDKKLFGICGFSQEAGIKRKHSGFITQMYIQPGYQGKKLGLVLVQTAIDEAFKIPGLEQIVLGAMTTNFSAIKTYQRAGFTDFGLHWNYSKIGDIYYHMRLMILERNPIAGQ